MKNKNIQFSSRQGDVAIDRIDSFPAKLKKAKLEDGRVILAHGEVTGHAHSFCAEDADKFTDEKGAEFFDVKGRSFSCRLPILRRWKNQVMVQHPKHGVIEFNVDTIEIEGNEAVIEGDFGLLKHDEHNAHGIPAGLYKGGGMGKTVRQREYHPQEIRRAAD